jgi:peptide/nickel transport system permease protein
VSERDVINKHALRNAWIPIITVIGNSISHTMAGSAVIESVFSFPGVGKLTVEAVMRGDVNMACGCIILTTLVYVVILLIVDVLYAFVDPRIKRSTPPMQGKRRKYR